MKQKKDDEAGAAFGRAGLLEPENPAVLEALGSFYAFLGELDQAEMYLSSAAKKSSAGSSPQIRYARFLKRIGSHSRNIATSIVNPFHRIGYQEINDPQPNPENQSPAE